MAQKPGLLGYVTAAFNARPMGMFVAPNWIGLAAAGLLGLANPGFWVLGASRLELGYLLAVATNRRFQNLIDAKQSSGSRGDWDRRIEQTLASLDKPERDRYEALSSRCRSILDVQRRASESVGIGLDAQAESLGRLTWMYLRLLSARQAITHVLNEDDGDSTDELRERITELQRQLKGDRTDADLARSQEGQIEILRQRVDRRNEAERKRTYIEAELTRLEEQVELIREQAALSTDPEVLSRRIDEIAATLGSTSQWIRDQQQVFGAMEDLLTDPPPVTPASSAANSSRARARETQ